MHNRTCFHYIALRNHRSVPQQTTSYATGETLCTFMSDHLLSIVCNCFHLSSLVLSLLDFIFNTLVRDHTSVLLLLRPPLDRLWVYLHNKWPLKVIVMLWLVYGVNVFHWWMRMVQWCCTQFGNVVMQCDHICQHYIYSHAHPGFTCILSHMYMYVLLCSK